MDTFAWPSVHELPYISVTWEVGIPGHLHSRLPCHKTRIIAVVKIDSATKPVTLQYSPSSAGNLIPLVLTHEREFDPLLIADLLYAAIQVAFHRSKLELSSVLVVEGNVSFSDKIDKILVPQLHF
jgi:hypothetical protein